MNDEMKKKEAEVDRDLDELIRECKENLEGYHEPTEEEIRERRAYVTRIKQDNDKLRKEGNGELRDIMYKFGQSLQNLYQALYLEQQANKLYETALNDPNMKWYN